MELTVDQMKVILDMYSVFRIEKQKTSEIEQFICEIAWQLDLAGYYVCDCCFDYSEKPEFVDIDVLPGGDVIELCKLCNNDASRW